MPSVFSMPGYIQIALLAFWLPTLISFATFLVFRKLPGIWNGWIMKAFYAYIGFSLLLHLYGWLADSFWMHIYSNRLALIGAIVSGIWAIFLTFYPPAAE